jgi:hypothetical protein
VSKIVIQTKHGKTIIKNRLSYPESVNERVNNAIVSGMFDGFLPVSIRQKRKDTIIECIVQDLVSANQYFQGVVSRKMFLDFAVQIAGLIKNCEKNMISANNLDLQKDRVFVDPITKAVKCIYWPVVNNQQADPPNIFLKQLPYDISFNPHEDKSYIEQYANFFEGYKPFSINEFERFLLKLQGKVTNTTHTPSETLSGKLAEEESRNAQHSNPNIEYNPLSGQGDSRGTNTLDTIFCSKCGAKNTVGSNYCAACGNKIGTIPNKPESNPAERKNQNRGTTVLGAVNGGTVVLGYDEPDEPVYPRLIRKKTGESFSIDKPVFRIGTEQPYCDLFISDNTYISRSHADIITRDGRYYIVDKNSTNRTFVDGKVVARQTEVEVYDGTLIKLANEEFDFLLC